MLACSYFSWPSPGGEIKPLREGVAQEIFIRFLFGPVKNVPDAFLKFSPKKSPLSPALFHSDFDQAKPGSGKLPSNLPLELGGEVFSYQLCARIGDGKKNDVTSRQDNSLT